MSVYTTGAFWSQTLDRVIRGAGQGFLLGAGVASTAGDFAMLSWQAAAHGLAGAASMAVLTVAWAIAAPPGEHP